MPLIPSDEECRKIIAALEAGSPEGRETVAAIRAELARLKEVAVTGREVVADTEQLGCDLCSDNTGPMFLYAKCHMTAPLQASMENGILTLRCYIPECARVVAVFEVTAIRDKTEGHGLESVLEVQQQVNSAAEVLAEHMERSVPEDPMGRLQRLAEDSKR